MAIITELKLDRNSSKPVFELNHPSGMAITCLFDTGADTPVWCSGWEYFNFLYPDNYKVHGKFLLGGFGDGVSVVDMYVIPQFQIGNILFKQFHVAIDCHRRFAWDLVLSYTIFSKMDYTILNRNRNIPLLRVEHDRALYGTGIVMYEKDKEYVERIFSFLQPPH